MLGSRSLHRRRGGLSKFEAISSIFLFIHQPHPLLPSIHLQVSRPHFRRLHRASWHRIQAMHTVRRSDRGRKHPPRPRSSGITAPAPCRPTCLSFRTRLFQLIFAPVSSSLADSLRFSLLLPHDVSAFTHCLPATLPRKRQTSFTGCSFPSSSWLSSESSFHSTHPAIQSAWT